MKILFIYLFYFISFSAVIFSQSTLIKKYTNKALGISFNYDKDMDSPYGSLDSELKPDTTEWQTYFSKEMRIYLKYPKSLSFKEIDSIIYLGYYNKKNNSKFYSLIKIYSKRKSFEEIAKGRGFELDPKDSLVWYMPSIDQTEAQYIKGKNCHVLRGLASEIFDSDELGAHSIPIVVIKSLLVFDNNKPSRIVMYYSDQLTYGGEVGVPEVDVTENDFYIIASTIRIVNK